MVPSPNSFLQSPFANLIDDEDQPKPLAGSQAVKDVPLPTIPAEKDDGEDAAPAPTPAPAAPAGDLLPPAAMRPLFEATAAHFKVPVNVLMALAQQESSYDPSAINKDTGAAGPAQYLPATAKNLRIDPSDPNEAIPAMAMQLRERLDKGYSMADAVKEHFAGPDRKGWGGKTAAYGDAVLAKAGQIGQALYGDDTAPATPDAQAAAPDTDTAQNSFAPTRMRRADYLTEFRKLNPKAPQAAVDAAMAQYDQQVAAAGTARAAVKTIGPKPIPTPEQFFNDRLNERLQGPANGIVPQLPGRMEPDQLQNVGTPDAQPGQPSTTDTVAGNAIGGMLGTIVGAVAANAHLVGADDVAKDWSDGLAQIKGRQKELGGDTFAGKTASLVGGIVPAMLAAPESKVVEFATNSGLFGVPAFQDTYKQKLAEGQSNKLALVHAFQAFGMNTLMPTIMQKGTGALLGKLASEGTVGAKAAALGLGQAAGEGAAFSGINSVGDKLTDTIAGQQNDRPWIDPEDMAVQAAGFGAIRGAHMAPHVADAALDKVAPGFQVGRALAGDVADANFDPRTAGAAAAARMTPDAYDPSAIAPQDTARAASDVGPSPMTRTVPPPVLAPQQDSQGRTEPTMGDEPPAAPATPAPTGAPSVADQLRAIRPPEPDAPLSNAAQSAAAPTDPSTGPLSAAITDAAAAHAANPAPMPEQPVAAPQKPDLSTLSMDDLRARVKQIAQQTPVNSAHRKSLFDERRTIEKEIGARTKQDQEDANFIYRGQPEPYKDVQTVAQSDGIDNILIGKGIFTTSSKKVAGTYGSNIFKFHRPDESRVLNLSDANEAQLRPLLPDRFFQKSRLGVPGDTWEGPSPFDAYRHMVEHGDAKDAEDLLIEALAHKHLPSDLTWDQVRRGDAVHLGALPDHVRTRMSADLQNAGYDFVSHKGGIRAGGEGEHTVYIALNDKALRSADGKHSNQTEGSDGIDTAGLGRGTDGRGRSSEPAGGVGSDQPGGRAGTGTGTVESGGQQQPAPAAERADHAGRDPVVADGAANTQPALITRETRGTGVRFHGTSRPLPDGRPNNDYAMNGDNRNIYGQGFYTTDAADISEGYMRKGRGGSPTLYEVKERPGTKLYDMEQPMSPKVRAMAERAMGDEFPEEDLDGNPITTLRALFDEYRDASKDHGLTRDDVQEVFDAIRYNLENDGYHGYSHIGGLKTGKSPHEVRIYWTPEDHIEVSQSDLAKYKENADVSQRQEVPEETKAARGAESAPQTDAAADRVVPQNEPQNIPENIPASPQPAAAGTPAPTKNVPVKTAGERMRERVQAENPFMAFLATHGIHIDERSDTGGQGGKAGIVMVPGFNALYRKSGERMDELAALAHDAGFLSDADVQNPADNGGTRRLAELVARAVHGREIIRHAADLAPAAVNPDHELFAEAAKLGIETEGKSADQVYDEVVAHHDAQFDDEQAHQAVDMAHDADIPFDLDDPRSVNAHHLTDEEIDEKFGIQPKAEGSDRGETEGDPADAAHAGAEETGQPGEAGDGSAGSDGTEPRRSDAGHDGTGDAGAVSERKDDPYTRDLFGGQDLFDHIETRPNTLPAQKAVGRAAVSDLARRLGIDRIDRNNPDAGSRVSVLGSRLLANFVEGKPNQLVGQHVTTSHDLAALAQVYRDPRFETFRVFYVGKGGEIVGEAGYTSRMAAAVHMPNDLLHQIAGDKTRFGANGFYLLHNHPSGHSEPSPADVKMTKIIAEHLPGMLGHVVIDHNEYSVINERGAPQTIQAPHLNGRDFTGMPEMEHAMLGVRITSPEAVARAAKALQVPDGHATLILTTARSETQLLVDLPMGTLENLKTGDDFTRAKALVRRMTREAGAGGHRFIVLPEGADIKAPVFLKALAHGIVTDVVNAKGESLQDAGFYSGGDFVTKARAKVLRTNEGNAVAEQQAGYGDEEPAEPTPVPESTRARLARMIGRPVSQLHSAAHDIGSLFNPMAGGSEVAKSMAKDFANNNRKAQAQWNAFDTILRKNYTDEQLTAMWHAADQENDLRREGQTSDTRGLNSLPADQRETVEVLHQYGQQLWGRAKRAGLVDPDSEGVAYWTPRVAANIYADGSVDSIRPQAGEFSKDARNLRTSANSAKHRKYETTAESEAALKAKLGDDAAYVKNIRVMPMAMAQLEKAIAGRTLVNQIKAHGQVAGAELISETGGPNFVTFDHPALKRWMPHTDWQAVDADTLRARGYETRADGVYRDGERLATYRVRDGEVQQLRPILDSEGKPVLRPAPLFVHKDFAGPLKAVFSKDYGNVEKVYRGMMAMKGAVTSVIMVSPLTHNLVIWGKALPTMTSTMGWRDNLKNLGSLGFRPYFVGNAARDDHALMNELIGAGMVPVSGRGMNQDIEAIANGLKPGRSLTAKALGSVFDLASPKAGDAARRTVDKAGEIWHEKLLWDRVADMQAGMAVMMRSSLMDKGLDQYTANRIAAHFANRYAGMIPQEAMSKGAHMLLNLSLFSKSFTGTNIGAYKDLIGGLPGDVQAQIRQHAVNMRRALGDTEEAAGKAGDKALSQVQRIARTKAAAVLTLDVAAMATATSIAQAMIQGQGWQQFSDDFKKRLANLGIKTRNDPLSVLGHPLDAISSLSQTASNPHGKEDRVRVGEDEHGNSYYMRLPVGKVGEELKQYGDLTTGMTLLHNKLSTFLRPLIDLGTGKDVTGKRIILPHDNIMKQAAAAGAYWVKSQLPIDDIKAVKNAITGGEGNGGTHIHTPAGNLTMDQAKAVGWGTGLSVSKLTGGDAVAEMRYQNAEQQAKLSDVLPDVKAAMQKGDQAQAVKLLQDAGQTGTEIAHTLRSIMAPNVITSNRMKRFIQHASPEEVERMQGMMQKK